MKCKKTILIVFLNILNNLFLFKNVYKSYKTKNNESEDRIEELTNEIKALLYLYNSMTNREDKKNTYDEPVLKLRKNRVLEFKKLFLYGIIL